MPSETNIQAPPLGLFRFIGASGAATITGFFVDSSGAQVGNGFSKTIPTSGTPWGFKDVDGGTLRQGATGAIVNFDVDVYFIQSEDPSIISNFIAFPTHSGHQVAGDNIKFGAAV